MARFLYFDPFNGVAGDMILGALVDLGLPLDYLKEELAKLEVDGYELSAEKIDRQGLFGTNLKVRCKGSAPTHGGGHHHHHHGHSDGQHPDDCRGFEEISQLIRRSALSGSIKDRAIKVFEALAGAEATVHQSSIEEVHFHEVGAVDAIVDIVGACIGFEYFEVDEFYCSPIHLGGGTITFSHGTWPVPAPATVELLKGFPTRLGPVEMELTTPTGAAIVTSLVDRQNVLPIMQFERWGYGAGDKELSSIPNMLRLILGGQVSRLDSESDSELFQGVKKEKVVILEACIDDMDPEMFGHFLTVALGQGALDVFFTSAYMKKNRPGVLLSVLCRPEDQDHLVELIFRETTTLGLRVGPQERLVLARDQKILDTVYGPVQFKVGRLRGKVVNISPEFEDLSRIAEDTGEPLKEVRRKIMDEIAKLTP